MSLNKQDNAGLFQSSMVPAAAVLDASKQRPSNGAGIKMLDVKYNTEIASRQNQKQFGYNCAKALNFDDSEISSKEFSRKLRLKDSVYYQKSMRASQASIPSVHPPAAKPDLFSEKMTPKSTTKAIFQNNLSPLALKSDERSSFASSVNKISLFDNPAIEEVDSTGAQIKPAAQKKLTCLEKQKEKDTVIKSFLKNQQLFHKSDLSKNQPISMEAFRKSQTKSNPTSPQTVSSCSGKTTLWRHLSQAAWKKSASQRAF